jgi:hypothetical protein
MRRSDSSARPFRLPAPIPLICHGADQKNANEHALEVEIGAHEDHPILDDPDRQDAEYRAANATDSTIERRASEDDAGDDV